uniref:LIM domain-containing protein isoform X2 n=1 Tax=Doryrhamphus excisus TaxID=161450 RepID=UPI0025ADA458|nr:LIM domain-containing protein isoform X2 [Doryrhamphus excisus]
MEWNKITRSQSLRSVSTSRTDTRLLSRTVSVTQLVSRYQDDAASKGNAERDQKPSVEQISVTPPPVNGPLQGKKLQLKPPMSRNHKQEPTETQTTLSRSKSTGSLQNNTESIVALKARFESIPAPNKPKSGVKAADVPTPSKEAKSAMNGEMEELKKRRTPRASVNQTKSDAKKDNPPEKVVSRAERRTTTGGGEFERTVACESDEKRRTIADFRENAFLPEKEKLCVSVKALSAIYLSKVETQEAKQTPLKEAADPSSEAGRRSTLMRMAEDAPLSKDDHLGRQLGTRPQSQSAKETLFHQRQKCELRRLLKHTHPELTMLDKVVDEELAEVFNSDSEVTADESGYEGEVRARRLIFENCDPSDKVSASNPRMRTAEETLETRNLSKTSAVFHQPNERSSLAQPVLDSDPRLASSPDIDIEHEEEPTRIDVQATRRMFESQCVETSQLDLHNKPQCKVSTTGSIQEQQAHKPRPCSASHSPTLGGHEEEEESQDSIKTRLALMQNNPFISQNVEHSYVHTRKANPAVEDVPSKVKDRAHLFESMPFDRIRQQNKDEVETMVETLKESLHSLHGFNVIHADGSIIEANETMRAKKAKYFISQSGPEVNCQEVSEGNFQNFILRVLPRANLKPQVTYLKEACDGTVRSLMLNVPVHQDQDCKTANVLQLIEDVLNEDNSLRKGVIIQEPTSRSEDVMVYSLYKYSHKEDVRQYHPLQGRCSDTKSLVVSSDKTCQGPISPEVKGNVQLFRSCIERGELEYLKTLQAESTVEEQTTGQSREMDLEQRGEVADESSQEWAPVDMKRLRSIFSGDQKPSQPRQNIDKSTSSPGPNVTANMAADVPHPGHDKECNTKAHEEPKDAIGLLQFDTPCGDTVLQAESVEAVDNCEISKLQTAIHSLQQATTEARSLHQLSQEKQQSGEAVDSQEMHAGQTTPPRDCGQSEETVLSINSGPDIQDVASEEIHKGEEVPEKHIPAAVVSKDASEASSQPQEEEHVLQGKLKAALDSLERSNINVTQGDFRAAMIYRNSSKPPQERPKTDAVSGQKTVNQDVSATLSPSSQHEVREEGKLTANAESTSKDKSQKSRRTVGPKPAIPPKPEHLKVKEPKRQSTNSEKQTAELCHGGNTAHVDQHDKDLSHRNAGVVVEQDGGDQGRPAGNETRSQTSQEIHVFVNKDDKDMNLQERRTQDMNEGEAHVDVDEVCHQFASKTAPPKRKPPVKPKRVKIAQPEDKPEVGQPPGLSQPCSNPPGQKDERITGEDAKVALRPKKGRTETEDERRQRLSVHMDEIMRGNISAAMEIFDNLRKQEELQSILSRVEEIEEDTSNVDVRSLRRVFEDVPDWVVHSSKKKDTPVKTEHKEEMPTLAESKSSMAHVFGDLERASEEIMNLKEQTLARLVDIEDAIKKALYSVSTLKSDSDIAGLSCLFKESLGSSANISKISIGSSKTKQLQEQEGSTAPPGDHNLDRSPHPTRSPTSSPAFISIQSAARKSDKAELALPPEANICPTCQHSQKPEETFCTTTILQCSPGLIRKTDSSKQARCSPQREISVLEVHTDLQGSAKTITENYERTDACGNRIYSSKTSTVVTAQTQNATPPTGQAEVRPAVRQIATYPEIMLPSNNYGH